MMVKINIHFLKKRKSFDCERLGTSKSGMFTTVMNSIILHFQPWKHSVIETEIKCQIFLFIIVCLILTIFPGLVFSPSIEDHCINEGPTEKTVLTTER